MTGTFIITGVPYLITATNFDEHAPFRVAGITVFCGQGYLCAGLARFLIRKNPLVTAFQGQDAYPDGHQIRYGGPLGFGPDYERRLGLELLGENSHGIVIRVYNLSGLKNSGQQIHATPSFDFFLDYHTP